MKSSRSSRQPYAGSERKNGKRSEKAAKLDRKSSRGMIYENEELRLRTININAEVERGQSDIKRLRRENEQLRREIWTLRDECDRLNKRFKARLVDAAHEHGGCNARGSGGSSARRGSCSRSCSNSRSEDSDSCDTCKGDHDDPSPDDGKYSPNECCQDGSCRLPPPSAYDQMLEEAAQKLAQSQSGHGGPGSGPGHGPGHGSGPGTGPASGGEAQPLHSTFDHLSVVSEETLSNSEVMPAALQTESLLGYTPDINGSQTTLPSLVGPLTPLTPIELVANQLNDLQAVVPPLSYFENVVQQQHMGSSIGSPSDSGQTTGSGSGQTVVQTNGWDYNLQSPFTQRKYPSAARDLATQGRYPAPPMTTFGPNTMLAPPAIVRGEAPRLPGPGPGPGQGVVSEPGPPSVETVAITTVAANSPKHFFAPLKPRLKLNTTLANRSLVPAAVPVLPAPAPAPAPPAPSSTAAHCEPPDIFVSNALASPYQRPGPTDAGPAPPPLPQRQSPQTDSANLEAILNDIETISEDILAIQLEKKRSRENLDAGRAVGSATATATAQVPRKLQQEDKNKKPYRSEMNLLLTYDGPNPTITPTTATTSTTAATAASSAEAPTSASASSDGGGGTLRRARSLEREHTDSPSPHVPAPMVPFPPNRTYIGFDKLNACVGTARPPLPLPPSQAVAQVPPNGSPKAVPPTPPARTPPQPLKPRPDPTAPSESPSLVGLSPNKSHLFAAIANAAATKRSQFRAAPPHLTRSLDADTAEPGDRESQATATAAAEAAKRKARRVSIVCGENGKDDAGAGPVEIPVPQRPGPTALGSCSDLQAPNPTIMSLRQSSYSTPSSPHSGRRGSNGLLEGHLPAAFLHHQHSNSTPAARKASQDSTRASSGTATELAAASRSKCSRRHSDGTVVPGAQRISGASSGHNHRHHSHHHAQTSSLLGHNPHHSHHSHQDSQHETGTSISDRNSGSLSSSRESSASFSLRSHRRKISVSSHTGGKIPWCGCWGNGCL